MNLPFSKYFFINSSQVTISAVLIEQEGESKN